MSMLFYALIIDEDSHVRETLKRILIHLGCKVDETESAEDGMMKISKMKYNIVFAALCVKNIGARSIARWIKTNSANTIFFIVTSWKGQLERNILLADGIHGVIHKPLLFAEIRDVLLEHLG